MNVQEMIQQMIRQAMPHTTGIEPQTNLYLDLRFDSLAFITLLTNIEAAFSIQFEIIEMERCVVAGTLIAMVQDKIKERT